MSNVTDFVPFEWDHAKFAPIRLAFSGLERELNELLDNEFTWSVFVTPVLVVFTTFLLAYSAMDFVFVLHGTLSFAAILFVRLKQISGRLLSKLTSVTRFLLRLSGATFAVSMAGILSGPCYRFSQKCNEQLTMFLLESLSNLSIFANEHVVPVLETMLESVNATLSQVLALGWAFADETIEQMSHSIPSEIGETNSQVMFTQISSFAQQIFHLTKEANRRNNEMNLELLGTCLVVFTILSGAFKLFVRKPSTSKVIETKNVGVESSQTEVEEHPQRQESSPPKGNDEQQVLHSDDFQTSSTPIKASRQVEAAARAAMATPFMTPISVISALGKNDSDSWLNDENELVDNNDENIMLEFSECMTSVKPPSAMMNSQEGVSVIDLSLEEDNDDDNNNEQENDALSIHSPSPVVTVRSRSIQTERTRSAVGVVTDDASSPSASASRLAANQAKIGLMVTVLGGEGTGRRLRRAGVGKITMIHDDGTVDVKFMIERGQETRVPMDFVLVGSHPNAAVSINSKSNESGLDGYILRPGARDSLATRRRLSALTDLSNLSDHSAASAASAKPSSTSSSLTRTTTTTTKKPLYRAQRTSDVVTANVSSGGVTTRASLRTRRASLE